MTTGARGYRGSCDRGDAEVRLSPENSRSNVGKKRSPKGFQGNVASFARECVALATETDGLDIVRSKGLPDQGRWWQLLSGASVRGEIDEGGRGEVEV